MDENCIEVAKQYLARGVNIIPFFKGGGTEKSRYPVWGEFKDAFMSIDKFFNLSDKVKATHVAAISGKISNNLFCIDIDCKYNKGFEVTYFNTIKEFDGELYDRLRIHKTKSGGYHIFYFLPKEVEIGKSEKIAQKMNEENKAVCFLETKGEGGLFTILGEGYEVFQQRAIPTLTEEEHNKLLNIGRSFNEVVKIEKPKVQKRELVNYSENPFDAYNESEDFLKILEDRGWKKVSENTTYTYYTRPESKSNDVHAAHNKQKNFFFVHTSSTDLEPNTGYSPASILMKYHFNGDGKACFQWLINNGFGKLTRYAQEKIIEKSLRSDEDVVLPKTIDHALISRHDEIKADEKAKMEYGKFWQWKADSITINRHRFIEVAENIGFCLYKGQLRVKKGRVLQKCDNRGFQDIMKGYVYSNNEENLNEIKSSLDAFYQRSTDHAISQLVVVDKSETLQDTKDTCYKFFKNCYIKITTEHIFKIEYSDNDPYILSEKIKDHEFEFIKNHKTLYDSLYLDFLNKSCELYKNELYIKRIIGYLAHEYKDEATGYIIVLTEQCENPMDGGGSGKNVFCNLLKGTTTYISKNGTQIKYDEKFFQMWNGEKVFGISDVPKGFDYSFLKEASTGTFTLKKLFKDEVSIAPEDGMKFIVQTNFSYDISDGGLKRRIIPLEFTDFFTKSKGVDKHYGKYFPNDWSYEDWCCYHTFIAECVQTYLKSGMKLESIELSESGWRKLFSNKYRSLAGFIYDKFDEWVSIAEIEAKTLRDEITSYYNEQNTMQKFRLSPQKQNDAILEYAEKHGCTVQFNVKKRNEFSIPTYYVIFEKTNND